MIGVVRRLRIPAVLQHFLDTHTVVVVLEGQGLSVAGHFPKLSANRPFVSPTTIIQRIADCIIRNSSAVVCGQFVLPIRIAVGIRNRLNCSAQRACGVSVLHLGSDVSAAIVVINPRRILMRIIHTDELSQRIIGIGRGQITSLLGDDVSTRIILILKRNAVLGDLLYQRGGTVRAVCAVDILIAAGQLACWSACLLRRRIRLNLRSDEKSGYVRCT